MVHPSSAHCPLLRLCPLQKRERKANKDYGKNFKEQPSKEDKQAKRKQILASIGEWLVSRYYLVGCERILPRLPLVHAAHRFLGCEELLVASAARSAAPSDLPIRSAVTSSPFAGEDLLVAITAFFAALSDLPMPSAVNASHPPQARTCWWPPPTSPSASPPPSPVSAERQL